MVGELRRKKKNGFTVTNIMIMVILFFHTFPHPILIARFCVRFVIGVVRFDNASRIIILKTNTRYRRFPMQNRVGNTLCKFWAGWIGCFGVPR